MADLYRRFGPGLASVLVALVLLWLAGMVLAPSVTMIEFALRPNLPPAAVGGPEDRYSLDNILYLWGEDVHRRIFFKTIWASALVATVTFIVCYPIAYWMAQHATQRQLTVALMLVFIPFLINEVLRTLAWFIILAFRGPLNAALLELGLIDAPMRWQGDGGVLAAMVYAYILFMLLPIYNAVESLEKAQVEAARDLGAAPWRIHARIVIPHARAGIATGFVFTFMLAAGSYVAPALLGSPGSRWFTEIIYNWFFEGGNWNQGAAYAFLLLVLCIGFMSLVMKVFKVGLGDIAK